VHLTKSTAYLCHSGSLSACEPSQRQSSATRAVALFAAVLSTVTLTQASSRTSIRAESASTFSEQGLIPLQQVSFLTPTIKSSFLSPLMKIEMLKIFPPVLQSLEQKTHHQKPEPVFLMLEEQGLVSPAGSHWCTQENGSCLLPPEFTTKKPTGAAALGEDLFLCSWAVSTERFEAGVQSRRTRG